MLPEAFLQAAAEKDREEGLDALAELENELETEKKERHDAVEAAGVVVIKPDPNLGDSSAIRAARVCFCCISIPRCSFCEICFLFFFQVGG